MLQPIVNGPNIKKLLVDVVMNAEKCKFLA